MHNNKIINFVATKSHTAQQTYDKREELARDKPTSSGTKFQPAAWKPKS